jgi:UDP-glucuronate 4-epimerase
MDDYKIKKKILVTGMAGFIGFHLVKCLLENEELEIVGIDNINDYYSVDLKYARLNELGVNRGQILDNQFTLSSKHNNLHFIKCDISDTEFISKLMIDSHFNYVVNLAAQAGVRYSLENPMAYIQSNITGFLNILEGCRSSKVEHLIYASTSSVYGLNKSMPLKESQATEHPISLYSSTKKSNELMAHTYSHLFDIPTTGLRFFTVYGPWGRPDMALFLFTEAILSHKPLNVFNNGQMIRDFTYVGDIVKSIKLLISKPPQKNPDWDNHSPKSDSSSAPYNIFNIGNGHPIPLENYISAIENELNIKAKRNYMEMQPGDVPETNADTSKLSNYIDFKPNTDISIGIRNFVKWYLEYNHIVK